MSSGTSVSPCNRRSERLRRLESNPLDVWCDTCQLRIGQFANQFVVVDSDNCHFLRYADVGGATSIQYLSPKSIVTRQNSDRPRQFHQPVADRFLPLLPSLSAVDFEGMAGELRRLATRDEVFAASLRLDMPLCSTKRHVSETLLIDVFECHRGDEIFVRMNRRHVGSESWLTRHGKMWVSRWPAYFAPSWCFQSSESPSACQLRSAAR